MLSTLSSAGNPIPGGDSPFFSPSRFSIGSDYQTLTPTKGTAPYTLTGTLPSNVTFTPSTGVLTGPAASQWIPKPIASSGNTYARGAMNAVSSDGASEFIIGSFSGNGSEVFGAHTAYRTSTAGALFVAKRSSGEWLWVSTITGSGQALVDDMVATSDGGAVIVGSLRTGSVIFSNGGTTAFTRVPNINSTGASIGTGFIAKINASGDWVWVETLPSDAYLSFKGVSATSDGGFWVTGYFQQGSITVTSPTLTNSDNRYLSFVIKFSSTGTPGNALANTQPSSYSQGDSTNVAGVATASDGGAVIVGRFRGFAVHFGSNVLTKSTTTDSGFVAKVDPTGTSWSWAVRTPSSESSEDVLTTISASTNGDMIVGGDVRQGSLTLGSSTVTATNPEGSAFVAKISSSGTWLWGAGTTGTATLINTVRGVDASPDGGAYIVGSYRSGGMGFGSYSLPPTGTATRAFVAKVSSSGAWQFASGWASGTNELTGVVADATGARVTGSVRFYPVTIGNPPDSVTFTPQGWDVVSAKVDSLGNWLIGQPGFPASVEISWSGGSQNVGITAF